jgi:hypothetical protein
MEAVARLAELERSYLTEALNQCRKCYDATIDA